MRVPGAEKAIVAEPKILRYLLDATNPLSRGKPAFFFSFGFTREEWRLLASALTDHIMRYDVASTETTEHGVIYRVIGALSTPDGRDPVVRSAWIVLHGDSIPRFVTAVPNERRRQ